MRSLFRAVLFALLLLPVPALARSESKPYAYQRDTAWSAAVRFVAVDERAKILDKDPDAGYVLFEFKDSDGKTYRGSLEVVILVNDGTPSLKFVVSLVDRPSWMEIAMLTRLEAKLRAELGAPNPQKPKPKPEPPKDPPKDKDPKDPDPQPPLSRTP
ncbi:MAG: hypothetical protein ABI867_17235 [Kofleriaceae bacterium]